MLHRNSLFPILSDRRRGRRSNPNNWSMQVTFLTQPSSPHRGGRGVIFFIRWGFVSSFQKCQDYENLVFTFLAI